MAREEIPINKDLVTWARKRAGLTVAEAAKIFSSIEDWEAGAAFPTYPQLERLADELKVPIAVFFFPEPPQTPPIRESFRTLPDAEFDHIPRRVGFLLRKAKALQLNLTELTQGRNPAPRLITRDLILPDEVSLDVRDVLSYDYLFGDDVWLDAMAARVRDFLGVTLADQYAWPEADTALKAWRKSLHDVGIFVFKDAFKADEYS
jgi:transcriptional regulator with XRE-family HTH domain